MIERCQDCGIPQPVIWTAPDQLWAAVTGRNDGDGVLCPMCFDRKAREQGRFLRWVPREEFPLDSQAWEASVQSGPSDEWVRVSPPTVANVSHCRHGHTADTHPDCEQVS